MMSPDDQVRLGFVISAPPASMPDAVTVTVAPGPAKTTALGDTVMVTEPDICVRCGSDALSASGLRQYLESWRPVLFQNPA